MKDMFGKDKYECSLHSNTDEDEDGRTYSYTQWQNECDKKSRHGLRQLVCPECDLYIWEDLFHSKKISKQLRSEQIRVGRR